MRVVVEFCEGADPEAVASFAEKVESLVEAALIYGPKAPVVERDVVGGIGNLKTMAGARVSSVDVLSDGEAVIHTSGGSWRIRADADHGGSTPHRGPVILAQKSAARP